MRLQLSIVATIALLVIATLHAHEKYRIVGVVQDRQADQMRVKTKDGHRFTIYLDDKTVYQREKKKVPKSDLTNGQTVVVDALGDGEDDLGAVTVNIVPAISSPPSGKPPSTNGRGKGRADPRHPAD